MQILSQAPELNSPAVYLAVETEYKFKLNAPIQSISFRLGENNLTGPLSTDTNKVIFYDANGEFITYIDLDENRAETEMNVAQSFSVTFDPGKECSYFIYVPGNEYAGVSFTDIAVTSSSTDLIPVSNIVSTEGAYYGDTGNDVFESALASNVALSAGVHGQGGTDTFKLTGADQVLDMNEIGSKFSSIEILDIKGTGDNTLKLSLGDVLENGGKNLFLADNNIQLVVKGDAGDKVVLDDLLPNGTDPGDWAAAGAVTVEGVVYNTYQHSALNAELLVQQGVTVDLV